MHFIDLYFEKSSENTLRYEKSKLMRLSHSTRPTEQKADSSTEYHARWRLNGQSHAVRLPPVSLGEEKPCGSSKFRAACIRSSYLSSEGTSSQR